MTVIELEGVEKSYGDLKVLKGIDLEVGSGEIFGILGPNGVGKTTLFQTIIGLLKQDSGKIKINGELNDHSKELKRKIGYLPSDVSFYEDRSARKNLEFFSDLADTDPDIDSLLEMAGLENDASRKVGEFSTGMKKRLGIAQSLIKDPEIIIYDEPTTGLDPEGKKEFKDLVRKINSEGEKTIVISSHITTEIDSLCDRFAILKDGKVVASGTKEELGDISDTDYRILIETREPEKVEEILEEDKRDFERNKDRLTVRTREDIRNQLFQKFTEEEIDIKKIELKEETLETTYLRLTSGN